MNRMWREPPVDRMVSPWIAASAVWKWVHYLQVVNNSG